MVDEHRIIYLCFRSVIDLFGQLMLKLTHMHVHTCSGAAETGKRSCVYGYMRIYDVNDVCIDTCVVFQGD